MLAIQAALNVSEDAMAYALVMDSICGTFYVMFLLWAIGFSHKFNAWTKADTRAIDEVGAALENQYEASGMAEYPDLSGCRLFSFRSIPGTGRADQPGTSGV